MLALHVGIGEWYVMEMLDFEAMNLCCKREKIRCEAICCEGKGRVRVL